MIYNLILETHSSIFFIKNFDYLALLSEVESLEVFIHRVKSTS